MGLVDRGRLPKPLTQLFNMGRSYSLWVYQWGLACCAIEMGAAFGSPRYDVMRLGVIPLPASPRQADLVVISGTVTDKTAYAVHASDLPKSLGHLSLSAASAWGAAGGVITLSNIYKRLTLVGVNAYAVLIARGAPTYASTSDVSLRITTEQVYLP